MTHITSHRLEGLESDNLLAFLAMLGLLRSLEAVDRNRSAGQKLRPRTSWDISNPPLRPRLHIAVPASQNEVADAANKGVAILSHSYDLGESVRADLNYSQNQARTMLHTQNYAPVNGDPFTWITGLNPAGDIVGFYNSQDGKQHGFVLAKGKFITIDIPGAISTEANGIDPQGDVVGRYVTPDGHTHTYFLAKVT